MRAFLFVLLSLFISLEHALTHTDMRVKPKLSRTRASRAIDLGIKPRAERLRLSSFLSLRHHWLWFLALSFGKVSLLFFMDIHAYALAFCSFSLFERSCSVLYYFWIRYIFRCVIGNIEIKLHRILTFSNIKNK